MPRRNHAHTCATIALLAMSACPADDTNQAVDAPSDTGSSGTPGGETLGPPVTTSGAEGTAGATESDAGNSTTDDDTAADENGAESSGGLGGCVPAGPAEDLGAGLQEFPLLTPGSRPQWLTPAGESIWFTQPEANKIGRSTFGGVMTEYEIATPGVAPKAISGGPNGAHWFVGTGVLGSVTDSDGQMTLYELPEGGDGVGIGHGIPGTPDVWYTDNGRSAVGRFNQGEFTEFTIPYAGSDLGEILLGPDNNVWFSDRGTNRIVSLTPEGTFTQFDIPTPNADPVALTQADGVLWFAESAAGKLARLTTDGTFTEFELPTPCAQPVGLAVAADNAVWFTQRATHRVGRMTTDGTFISEFSLPTPDSEPARLMAKSNGTVWLLETNGNNLVLIEPL